MVSLVAGVLALTAGCGGGRSGDRVTTTTIGAPRGAAASTSSSTPTTTAPGGRCRTADLTLGAGIGSGALGRIVTDYYFANVGKTSCALTGYPGFAVLDAAGNVVQRPAVRAAGPGTTQAQPVRTVTLGPGQLALFVVADVDNVPNPDCPQQFPEGTTLQVYPPGETTPIRKAWSGGICDLEVGPVQSYGSATDTTGVIADCSLTATMKPTAIGIACGDGGIGLRDLSWTSWTSTRATAAGTLYENDCRPDCAGGTFHDYPATITLSDVVGSTVGRLFSHMHVVYTGAGPQGQTSDDFDVPLVPA